MIAGGGPLPLGLEVRTLVPLALNLSQDSFLNSLDAMPFEDSLTVIAGLTPASPSRFFTLDGSTRNGGLEGAVASNNHRLYQIREADQNSTSNVSERGVWGESFSQASLTTEFHKTSARASVFNERRFSISNQNATKLTFGIQGTFEMNMFAVASGMYAFAESVVTAGLWFTSSNVLDIQFVDLKLYEFNKERLGANTTASINRETDVVNTGRMSMAGIVRASNAGAADGDALATSRMQYALGITLQPGEEITMAHNISYSTMAEITSEPRQVFAPSSMALLCISILGIGLVRRRKSSMASHQ
ncbi:MAG: hypothetical protein ACJASL_000980 [Paraglaciecola sp.]